MKEFYIGMDVRKDSVYLAVLDDRKVRSNEKSESDLIGAVEVTTNSPQPVKVIRQYQKGGKVFVAYEAGCPGFDPYYFLAKHGIACEIIPANTVFRPGNEKKLKTDRRDAVLITRMLKREEAQSIHIQYLSHIENLIERIKRMEKRIEAVAREGDYAERVQKLRAFRGIDYLTALALVCETGDFRRFPRAGAFMSYPGLVPSEFSDGSRWRQGGITKAGNTHIRKFLTESAWHYPRAVTESNRLAKRRIGANEPVIVRADNAMRRLHDTCYKMIHHKKNSCVAITAVSRQLAGYIWGVVNMDV
jgi:transposase